MRKIYLILIMLVLITLLNLQFFIKTKKEFNYEIKYSKELLTTAKKIEYLKQSFKPIIPKFCKKEEKDKIFLICNNLNRFQLNYLNTVLQKSKISSFDIEKNKTINAYLELNK